MYFEVHLHCWQTFYSYYLDISIAYLSVFNGLATCFPQSGLREWEQECNQNGSLISLSFCILTSEVTYHYFYHILFVRHVSLIPAHPQMKEDWATASKGRSSKEFVDIFVKQLNGLGIVKIDMNFFHVFHGWEAWGPVKMTCAKTHRQLV